MQGVLNSTELKPEKHFRGSGFHSFIHSFIYSFCTPFLDTPVCPALTQAPSLAPRLAAFLRLAGFFRNEGAWKVGVFPRRRQEPPPPQAPERILSLCMFFVGRSVLVENLEHAIRETFISLERKLTSSPERKSSLIVTLVHLSSLG